MTRKTYTGPIVDVSFDREICQHAGECVRGMPEVFDVAARPWINPTDVITDNQADQLVEVVGRCPSRALLIERRDPASRIRVVRNEERNRYEVLVDGQLAGFAEYMLTSGLITFTHTEIFPEFEGRGIGSELAKGALDDVRAAGRRRVLPLCPFIKGWIQHHPDYLDLVNG